MLGSFKLKLIVLVTFRLVNKGLVLIDVDMKLVVVMINDCELVGIIEVVKTGGELVGAVVNDCELVGTIVDAKSDGTHFQN